MEKFLQADSNAALSKSPDSAGKKRKRSSSKPTSAEKGYFELRKEKLQEQAAKPESRPKIFAGLVLYFNGRTDGISAHHLAKMVQQHGGDSTPQLSVKKVSYVIATNLNGSKTQQALQRSRKVVHPDWITDSIKAGKLLPCADYLTIRRQGHTMPDFIASQQSGQPLSKPVYSYSRPVLTELHSSTSSTHKQHSTDKQSAKAVAAVVVAAAAAASQSSAASSTSASTAAAAASSSSTANSDTAASSDAQREAKRQKKAKKARAVACTCLALLVQQIAGFAGSLLQHHQHVCQPHRQHTKMLLSSGESNAEMLQMHIMGRIANIDKSTWNGLLAPDDSPFLEYDWIHSLEESGCASDATGWESLHVLVTKQDAPHSKALAAVPLYLKSHSMGEFIFDQGWAEAAHGAGIRYYPKLLVAVPFTPAAGARVLLQQGLDPDLQLRVRRAIGIFLNKVARESGISSVHMNFCSEHEVAALTGVGYMHRKSLQYHWRNEDKNAADPGTKYADFDAYLGAFASKRRIKIRRERRSVTDPAEGGITMNVYRGAEISDELLRAMFDVYLTTIENNPYGRQYLNVDFFERLGGAFRQHLCFVTAERDGELIGGTFNVVKAGRFYGRYWGTHEFVKNLHFETCYYKSIEYCIEQGLDTMEPGAGGGDFKFLRGFDPAVVNSVHLCTHPSLQAGIRQFLRRETEAIDESAEYLNQRSAVGKKQQQQQQPEGQ